MDGEVHVIHSGASGVDLGVSQYAKARGKSERQVRRWLAENALPGAYKDHDGQWRIPASAMERRDGSGALVGHTGPQTALAAPVAAPAPQDPLGHLVPLDEAARRLETSALQVQRMGEAGLFRVGPWGPHGALRVYLPPS
jgi:hypothetical protein